MLSETISLKWEVYHVFPTVQGTRGYTVSLKEAKWLAKI